MPIPAASLHAPAPSARHRIRRALAALTLTTAVVAAAACGSSQASNSTSGGNSSAVEKPDLTVAVVPAISAGGRIAQDEARRSPLHLWRLGGFSSPKIADALDTVAQHPDTAAPVAEAALAALIERAPDRGVSTALRVIDRRPALKPSRVHSSELHNAVSMHWQQSVHACVALLKSDRCADNLDAILSRLTGSAQFAADVITAAQLTRPRVEAWPGLSPDQLATLYIWAETTLPHEPDHPHAQLST